MWAGYSQACDESGQEVDERSEKASRAGGGDGSAMEGLVPEPQRFFVLQGDHKDTVWFCDAG